MAQSRVGSYPIGFRRGWSDWQRDLPKLIRWTKANDFPHLDFGPLPAAEAKLVMDAGITVASVDLKTWPDLCSPDANRRKAAVETNATYVREMVGLGVGLFLCVIAPAEPQRPRAENLSFAGDSFSQLCALVASTGAKIVLEGAPGRPPYFASLGCTPADLNALFDAVNSPAIGVNFDPSHLVRMGIDPVRFIREFAPRIHHAHAKDVAMAAEDLYQHGNLQPATLVPPHKFGGHHWRYAPPGHGVINWSSILQTLTAVGYHGRISIELEDANYNDDESAEQRGLIESRNFLASL